MQSTKCPECRDEVSVPAGLPLDAELECPLCGGQYPFSRIAGTLPPILIVRSGGTGGSEASAAAAQSGGFSINVGSIAGNDASDAMAFDSEPASFVSDSATGASQTGSAKPATPSAGGNRKKEKNLAIEGLKVLLGGLLAFPLVQLGVWWIAGRDPLDIGPSVSKVVPFVVPKKHRGILIESSDGDEKKVNQTDEPETAGKNQRSESKPRDRTIDTGSRTVDMGQNNSVGKSGTDSGLKTNPDVAAENAAKSTNRVTIAVLELMKEKNSAAQSASPEITASLATLAPPKQRNSVGQLNEALTTFLQVTFDHDGDATPEIQDQQYATLVSLAEHLAGVQGDASRVKTARATAELTLARTFPKSLSATSMRAKKSLEDESNIDSGIAVCGTLKSVASSNDIVHARIAWAHEPTSEVDVYSSDLSLSRYAIESNVIALGRIVDGQQISLASGPTVVATVTVLLN